MADGVLIEYIKRNPQKRPFPGAPAPRLPFENESDELGHVLVKAARILPRREPIYSNTPIVDSIATRTSGSSDIAHDPELGPGQHEDRYAKLMDIMRKALIVNPGAGAVGHGPGPKIAKKGIIDGAHDDSPSSKSAVSSTSSLDERSHGLPDGAQDHDYHEHGLLEILRSDEGHSTHVSQHGLEVPHKTVLKHPHIEIDVNGNFVDLPAKRLNETHVRIVTPREEN